MVENFTENLTFKLKRRGLEKVEKQSSHPFRHLLIIYQYGTLQTNLVFLGANYNYLSKSRDEKNPAGLDLGLYNCSRKALSRI